MLDAVIIVLREALEAALIISLLLASSYTKGINRSWVICSLLFGATGATLYGVFMADISDAFEGVGQEIVNASIQTTIVICLAIHNIAIAGGLDRNERKNFVFHLITMSYLLAVGMGILHEGAEIFIYLYGFSQSMESLQPILLGGSLGLGIGLSVGALFYYALVSLALRHRMQIICGIIMVVAAGIASQAVLFLIQADILPSQLPIWNSSSIISEQSVVGQLLYALFSYEATPTPVQVVCYISVLLLIMALMKLSSSFNHVANFDSEIKPGVIR